jgi:hypothetical protein
MRNFCQRSVTVAETQFFGDSHVIYFPYLLAHRHQDARLNLVLEDLIFDLPLAYLEDRNCFHRDVRYFELLF